MGEGTEECHPTQRTPRHCSLDLSTDVLNLGILPPDNFHKVKYDRPGECSPEKDCLR